ncbi:MAG: DUF4330 family protein [Clostridia bacterium]|nr:DUF4330 family protein [Clostridia bacterium]
MQDKKTKSGKKLFGVLNVIDVIFIVVVILAVAVFAVKHFVIDAKGDSGSNEYVIGFFAEEISDFVVNDLKIGSKCAGDYDYDDLGEIIDIDVYDSISYGNDSKGQITRTTKPGWKSVVIYSKVKAATNDYGLFINGHTYSPGHTFVLYTEGAKLYLRVFSLQKVTEHDENGDPVFEKPDVFTALGDMEFAVTDDDSMKVPTAAPAETSVPAGSDETGKAA